MGVPLQESDGLTLDPFFIIEEQAPALSTTWPPSCFSLILGRSVFSCTVVVEMASHSSLYSSAFITITKHLRETELEEERFTLAHGFSCFHAQLLGPVTFSS